MPYIMSGNLRSIMTSLLVVLMVSQATGPRVWAQQAAPTPEQLDQLLAPVALYPDALLSQIATASTNPQEILDVNAWLHENPGLTGSALTGAAEQHGFDPAFIVLVNFPAIVATMAEHIDDYAEIGQAFSADQTAVTTSIQRLRAQAWNSGALRTNERQKVEVQRSAGQTIYVIQPANPTVVYLPQYDPAVVYVQPAPGPVIATPEITFTAGIGIGGLMVDHRPWGWGGWGWNWGARRAYYNHGYWNGWASPYHPPHYWYRPRPIVWVNRPGYRGNWGYRPPYYRPPGHPGTKPARPGISPGGYHPSPGKPMPARPARPTPAKPVPDPRPAGPSRPHTPDRPSVHPNTPEAPDRPSGRPSKPEGPRGRDRNRPQSGQPAAPGGNKPPRPDQSSGRSRERGAQQQPGSQQPGSKGPRRGAAAEPGGNQPDRPNLPPRQTR